MEETKALILDQGKALLELLLTKVLIVVGVQIQEVDKILMLVINHMEVDLAHEICNQDQALEVFLGRNLHQHPLEESLEIKIAAVSTTYFKLIQSLIFQFLLL